VLNRIVDHPAFWVTGKQTWIGGQDNSLFGRFWDECRAQGLFEVFRQLTDLRPGPQTRGVTLGISRVEKDPANRNFYYMIAVEKPESGDTSQLETYLVPASTWAVFECHGKVPESIVKAEIYAFTEWLPESGYAHALAPEMEVYPPESEGQSDAHYCEFWLPIVKD
jgi:AraC family transcriptional regulator